MSHVPHELAEEFPEAAERIHALKTSNAHFARLADEYHELNREIHRIETRVEPTSEEVEQDLRRKRVALKDEIAAMLGSAAA
ncbi:MAG: YdcH family protein [Salinarimonas sp.]